MKNNNKEKTYWNVKESSIDKTLLESVKKRERICRIATYIELMCNCLFCICGFILCGKYFSETAVIVCMSIILVVSLSTLIIEIVAAVNLRKLRKEVLKTQEETDGSDISDKKEVD